MEDISELESVREDKSEPSTKPETFSEVRKKRKRSKVTDMDTEDGAVAAEEMTTEAPAKRPVFPPVDASTLVVSSYVSLLNFTNDVCQLNEQY